MTKTLEEDGDVIVSPDDWAELVAKPAPLDVSAELQRQVDEYLAHGGRIQEFEPGETAIEPGKPLWSFPVGKATEPNPLKRAQSEARRKAIAVIRGDQAADSVLVAKMNLLLGTVQTGKDLAHQMGVSPSVIYRLCIAYFADDKRADRFRKRSVAERAEIYDAIMVPKIREAVAAGVKGLSNIAHRCGASSKYVSDVNKKHNLQIPKEMPGRRVGRPTAPVSDTPHKYEGQHSCLDTTCSAKYSGNAFYCPQCGHITAKGQARGFEE